MSVADARHRLEPYHVLVERTAQKTNTIPIHHDLPIYDLILICSKLCHGKEVIWHSEDLALPFDRWVS